MATNPVSLVLPDQPLPFSYFEGKPEKSRYTGKDLRRLELSLGVRGDDAHERLGAVLTMPESRPALISDTDGGLWEVANYTVSYQDSQSLTTHTYNVELTEHEELTLERVEIDGHALMPDRWSLSANDNEVLTLLVSLDSEKHQQFEETFHRLQTREELYFPVAWVGITDAPVAMRFGRCLWESLDGGAARHRIVLVAEQGDTEGGRAGLLFMEPENTRLIQQAAITKVKLDRLVEALRQANVLSDEVIDQLIGDESTSFRAIREFDRVDSAEDFFA